MPVLTYFALVGSILFGLIFFAPDIWGPAGPMPLTTKVAGLPAAYSGKHTVPDEPFARLAAQPTPAEPPPAMTARAEDIPASPLRAMHEQKRRDANTVSVSARSVPLHQQFVNNRNHRYEGPAN